MPEPTTEPIEDPSQVTPAWLNAVLRRNGHLSNGEVSAVRELERQTLPNSTIARLEVAYRGYARLPGRLTLKLSREPDPAWGGHEVAFYNSVTPPMALVLRPTELPFVRHFDAVHSSTSGRAHLLLEDLSPTHGRGDRTLPPLDGQCEGMVDALAALHAFWWQHPRLGVDIGVRASQASIDDQITSARHNLAAWLDMMANRVSPGRRATFERICGAWPARRVARLLAGQGITLVNRDTHAENCLYRRDLARERVRLIDWQSWRVDTGTDDLAYMITAHWYPERRARLEKLLVERYHQRLVEYAVPSYSWEDCWFDYKASIIRVLFCLVGGWQPGRSPALWFDRIERALMAYEGLGCAEYLP